MGRARAGRVEEVSPLVIGLLVSVIFGRLHAWTLAKQIDKLERRVRALESRP